MTRIFLLSLIVGVLGMILRPTNLGSSDLPSMITKTVREAAIAGFRMGEVCKVYEILGKKKPYKSAEEFADRYFPVKP